MPEPGEDTFEGKPSVAGKTSSENSTADHANKRSLAAGRHVWLIGIAELCFDQPYREVNIM